MKIYIYKNGKSETFFEEKTSQIISYGDVLRTVHFFCKFNSFKKIFILTNKKNKFFLKHFELPNYIKITTRVRFKITKFKKNDIFLNLEKDIKSKEIFNIKNSNHLGFFYVNSSWVIKDYLNKIYSLQEWEEYCNKNSLITWTSKLEHIIGKKIETNFFKNRNFIRNEIGLNWKVGKKWPAKQISKTNWESFAENLSSLYKVSWQKGFLNISEYIHWVKGCKLIITSDSLGLHIAQYYQIPTIALFGPTSSESIRDYKNIYIHKYDNFEFSEQKIDNVVNLFKGEVNLLKINFEEIIKKLY